ncbi:hypothetical protein HK100_006562 [Physocladia obscura]|uniref:SnoaL-like domain-containing protein n=1 Tax=Physocladia obscura TaxID=109957 RepID=A0AAD5X7G0_9FUNG|nr:hypothetical protein HK100_006562 [Physocladia obscura]
MAETPAQFLDLWHKVIAENDIDLLETLLSPSIEFHTPLYLKTRKGKQLVKAILASAISLFHNFKYRREFTLFVPPPGSSNSSSSSADFCLEFSATIDGGPKIGDGKELSLTGVDLIKIAQETDGFFRIVHFEVMLRPVNATTRFGELQAANIPKMAAKLSANKSENGAKL